MPWSRTRRPATCSCVERGLEAPSATPAPPACRVPARFAVSVVTWRQAATRFPASGRSRANRSRSCRNTGIDRSAHSVRRRPPSASRMSLMSFVALVLVAVSDIGLPGCTGRPLRGHFQLFGAVDVLPGEQLHLPLADLAALGGPTEMAVGRGGPVDRIAQVERLNDAAGREIEDFADR